MPNEELTRKCQGCGTAMVFDPQTGKLVCPGCHAQEDLGAEVPEGFEERDLAACLENQELNEEADAITVHCPNCGAETTFPKDIVAGPCSFCKTPFVASSKSVKTIRPQGVIPFEVTRETAAANFSKWLKSLWFLPGAVKKLGLQAPPAGVYRPMWTFDFRTYTEYTGQRGVYYYVTVSYTENGKRKTRQERRTRWTYVYGHVLKNFDDVLVCASSRVSRDLLEGLGAWSLTNAVEYTENVIQGFTEESYDVKLSDGLEVAKQKAEPAIKTAIRRDIGGDEQQILSTEIHYSHLTFKQLLVPFWSSHYRFKGKDYLYLVNGQSGATHGERPYSGWKITAFILFIAALCFGAYYFFTHC